MNNQLPNIHNAKIMIKNRISMKIRKKKVCITELLRSMEPGREYEFTIYEASKGSFYEIAKRIGMAGQVTTRKKSPTRFVVMKKVGMAT